MPQPASRLPEDLETILKELHLEAFSVANILQKLAGKFNFEYQRQDNPGREVLVYMKNLESFSYTHVAQGKGMGEHRVETR